MSYESVNKIKSLQQGIETFTGKSYGDLTAAVQELKNGYGGSGVIEVSELPTESIDENAVYKVVSGTESEIYIVMNGVTCTAEEYAASTGSSYNEYWVNELPSEMETTYSSVHVYVVDGMCYIAFGNSSNIRGLGEVIMGSTEFDKGYTDDITHESRGNGVYVQRGEPTIDWYIRENGEWKRISPDTQTKEVTYTESGEYEITPDDGKVISKATVKVAVPERYDEGYEAGKLDGYSEGYTASQNARQEKTFVENGEYTPDDGCSGFSKVTVNVTNTDTVDGWHVAVRSDGSDPPSGTINTITFVYGG